MIARRTRELAEAREAEQQLPHSSAQFAILVRTLRCPAIRPDPDSSVRGAAGPGYSILASVGKLPDMPVQNG
jgi:hypothetical protein